MKNSIKNILNHFDLLAVCVLFSGCLTQSVSDIGGGATPPRQLSIGGQRMPGSSVPFSNSERMTTSGLFFPDYGK